MDDSRWRLALAALGVGVAYVAWRARRRTEEVKLAALYVYPVKGCKGHSVARAKVTKWGLENDRIYMMVDEKNEFASQRSHPRMVLIHPDLPTERGITLRTADGSLPALHVALELKAPVKKVKVWDDWVPAVDQGDEAAQWLCQVLQASKLRLVRIAPHAQRATDAHYGAGETAFSDGFPLLLSSVASIRQVARQVRWAGGPAVGVNRFRPNLHVEGCRAFEEDEMRALVFRKALGTLRLPLVKPCSRCTVPGVDPATGEKSRRSGAAVQEVLRRSRAAKVLAPSARLHGAFFAEAERSEDVFFGQNCLVELSGEVEIQVGDTATVQW